jgi:hypothetical protein
MPHRFRSFTVLISFSAVAAAAVVVAHAQLSSSDNLIHACVATQTGTLRIVNAEGSCRANESPLSWGSGLTGYEIATTDVLFGNTPPSSGAVTVNCPAGKRVLGGGASALNDVFGGIFPGSSSNLTFESASYPVDEDTWTVHYTYSGFGPLAGVRGYATCAF